MGDFLTSATGTKNDFSASNPYTDDQTNQLFGQQQQLSNMLMQQAQGGGPNPAQMQYMQNAQQIAQQQAQNYASNRALNPALAARMAGNTAASVGQQAAGTAAIQQAQQQLASQQQLGALNQSQQGLINQSRLGSQAINANVAAGNQQMAGQMVGGVMSGAGAAAMALAHGGMVPHYADGGSVGPQSSIGKSLSGFNQGMQPMMSPSMDTSNSGILAAYSGVPGAVVSAGQGGGSQAHAVNKGMGQLGQGLAPRAPTVLNASAAGSLGQTDLAPMASAIPVMAAKAGGTVPGRAAVRGDSYKNDTVPAMVSPGEIVLPRHVTQAKDAPDRAKKFVEAILARENLRNKK